MFLDKLGMWPEFENAVILHIAPERNLPTQIRKMKPNTYIVGDLSPADHEIIKLDVTSMKFPSNHFDFVICNHVLEHVADDTKAMREIFRVLQPGGRAILQTPFSRVLINTFEDPSIDSDELRLKFYGETCHYRVYGSDLFDKLEGAGFKLDIVKSDKYFSRHDCDYYGVNYEEDLILVRKPINETGGP
jgi:SAM-dependent methyltransferase